MKPQFTEEEKWEDHNSLDPIDYHSFKDYHRALNDDDYPVLDEETIRAWVSIALGIIAFACLAIYLIIK